MHAPCSTFYLHLLVTLVVRTLLRVLTTNTSVGPKYLKRSAAKYLDTAGIQTEIQIQFLFTHVGKATSTSFPPVNYSYVSYYKLRSIFFL